MTIETKYNLKQMVYLVHDPEQQHRMVTEIHIITPKLHRYQLCCGSDTSEHFEYEISTDKDQVLVLTSKKKEE